MTPILHSEIVTTTTGTLVAPQRLDCHAVGPLRAALADRSERCPDEPIRLDLSGVEFADAEGIALVDALLADPSTVITDVSTAVSLTFELLDRPMVGWTEEFHGVG